MTTSNRLFGNISAIYMTTAQNTIFLLLRIYYFPTANISIIYLLLIEQLLQQWKSSTYLFTVHRKIVYDNFKLPIWKYFDDMYGYCVKPNFLATVYHTSIFTLRICQLFVYCKSTNNFSTGNRLYILLLCIEKLYDNFKSPICKHINYLYGYWAKPKFYATAHLLFSYCEYPNYLFNANRAITSTLEIVKVFDYST